MKTEQNGFIVPLLLAIIALLIVGGGVYYYRTKKADSAATGVSASQDQSAFQNVLPSTTADNTSAANTDYKIYTDSSFGYAFYYPSSWKVSATSNGASITNFGSTRNDEGPDTMSIKEVSGSKVTVQDAKFGDTTLYYDDGKNQWMEQQPDEESGGSSTVAVIPTYTISGLPIFGSTGRWATNIVALSHTKFLVVNITGSGDTKPFAPFVYGITQSNANVSASAITAAIKNMVAYDALANGPQGIVVLNSVSPSSGPAAGAITITGKGFMSVPLPALQQNDEWKKYQHVQVNLISYPQSAFEKSVVLWSGNPTSDTTLTVPIAQRMCAYVDIMTPVQKPCKGYVVLTPGDYTISVSVYGQQTSNSLHFTITGAPVDDTPFISYLTPSSAKAGATVTVHGQNLTGTEMISIGDVPLYTGSTSVSADGTEMNFVVPGNDSSDQHVPGTTYKLTLSSRADNGAPITSNSLDFTLTK